MQNLKTLIREVPDFPKPGILFYDLTTLLKDKKGFHTLIDRLCEHYNGHTIDIVAGIEAHVCVLQTVLDLLAGGFQVFVPADAISPAARQRLPSRKNPSARARSSGKGVNVVCMRSIIAPDRRKYAEKIRVVQMYRRRYKTDACRKYCGCTTGLNLRPWSDGGHFPFEDTKQEVDMKRTTSMMLILAGLVTALPQLSYADEHREGRREGRHEERGLVWHGGEMRHFSEREWGHWRGGNWRHARHEGRLGWWWIVGGVWYFYPQPVYPYPDPYVPPVVIEQQPPVVVAPQPPVVVAPQAPAAAPQAPQAQNWYYCEDSKTYYPYVNTCASGWKQVPATPR